MNENDAVLTVGVTVRLSVSVLTDIFPGRRRSAGTRTSPFWILLELRMMEVESGDIWSYETYKSSPPTNQHPAVYRLDALPVAQPTVSKH